MFFGRFEDTKKVLSKLTDLYASPNIANTYVYVLAPVLCLYFLHRNKAYVYRKLRYYFLYMFSRKNTEFLFRCLLLFVYFSPSFPFSYIFMYHTLHYCNLHEFTLHCILHEKTDNKCLGHFGPNSLFSPIQISLENLWDASKSNSCLNLIWPLSLSKFKQGSI